MAVVTGQTRALLDSQPGPARGPVPGGAARAAGEVGWRVVLPLALLLGGIGALLFGQSQYRLVPVFVALAVGGFALVARGRFWALVPLLLVEFTVSNLVVAELGATLRLLAALAAACVVAPAVVAGLRAEEPARRRVFGWAVLLVLVATVGNILHSDEEYALKYLRFQIVQLVALFAAAYALRTGADIRRVVLVVLGVAAVSGGDAILQHYDRSSALYGEASAQFVDHWKGRAIGLTQNPVLLANHLSLVLVSVLGVLLCRPSRTDRQQVFLWMAAALIAGGLYFTYTRSAVYAVGLGLVGVGLFVGGRSRNAVVGTVLGGALMFQLLQGTGLIGSRYYRTAEEDRSAATHEALWQVGFAIALDNWAMGIGHEDFEEVSGEYASELEAPGASGGAEAIIGNQRPHNDFLNVWLSWGVVALIAYCAMMLTCLSNFARAARSRDPLLRGLAVGGAGSLITYAANSAFHNYFDSSLLLWAYCGLSVSLARVAVAEPLPDVGKHVLALRTALTGGAARARRRAAVGVVRRRVGVSAVPYARSAAGTGSA